MTKYDSSQSPYNNDFDANKHFDMILFKGGRPVLNWELLELQSMKDYQIEMLGDTLFQEGDIISGMSIVPQTTSSSTTTSLPNSFSISSLVAVNSKINTGTYSSDGNIVVTSEGTLDTDYPEIDFTGTITKGLSATLSFSITQTSGTLKKFGISYDTSQLTPTNYTIDGVSVATSLNDMTGTLLVNTSGTQISLSDGKAHSVVVNFKTLVSGTPTFNLVVNPTYNALTTPVSFTINDLYIHDGTTSALWVINVNDTDAASTVNRVKNYTVTSGQIWLEGAVRDFESQSISIMGTGTETIGVKLTESLVTSDDDPSLLDHTTGAVTYGQPGADRTKYVVTLTYNDDSATPVFVFQDNKINQDAVKPDYSNLSTILAKRTYDQSGSFRVSGFDTTVGTYALDSSKLEAKIDAGQAYVRGYSINTSSTTSLLLDKAFDTATATNEGHTYNSSDSYITLENQPVQEVSNITANIQGVNNSVSRSTTGVIDQFTAENAYQVVSVKQGTVTYAEGTDFVVINGNKLSWGQDSSGNKLVNASVPTAGTAYSVIFNYNKNLTLGTDYKVETVSTNSTTGTPITAIDFKDMSGLKPISGSVVSISYVYFLARIDMIMITQNQSSPFTVIQGTPMPLATATPPVIKDSYSLELGYVLIYPNSSTATFTMQTVTNIPFSGLQKWSTRLDNIEYNIATQALSTSVKSSEDPVTTKDTFSDSFSDSTMSNTTKSDFNASFDFEEGEITIPSKAYADLTPSIASDASSFSTQGSLVTAPYTEERSVGQDLVTGVINVNEFQVFNVNGTMTITPSSDNWIDTEKTTVENDTNGGHLSLNRWWLHHNYSTLTGGQADSQITTDMQLQGINYSYAVRSATQTGYIISSGGTKTVESLEEYMREKTISFTANNFLPYEDNFSITIEGTAVLSPTPANSTYKGSTANTFKADGTGTIKGTFTIPGGIIPCGSKTIKMINPNGSQASAIYTAQGTMKDVESIINKTTYSVNLYDPLAQSFTLSDNKMLTSIKLYFATKPTSSDGTHTSDVIIQIRELSDDGYPNRTIKAEQTLTPNDINVSSDASVATKVTFDSAVLLTANQGYCIVIISDSNEYEMYEAVKGSSLISGDKSVLQSAPNSNGDLFISNNAQTWQANGAASLKFEVDTAYFNTEGVVVFDPIDLTSTSFENDTTDSTTLIDRLVTLTSYLTPSNTGMSWYIRILPASSSSTIDNMPWEAITVTNNNVSISTPGADSDAITDEKDLLTSSKEVQLKAVFSSDRYISPILTTEDLSLVGILTGTEGSWYSVNVDESDTAKFSHVKVQFDAYVPSGTSVTPYYSVDGGTTFYTLASGGSAVASPVSTQTISSYFTRYIYEADVPTATDQNHLASQIMFKLDMKSDTNFITPRVRKFISLMSETV